MKTVKTSRRTFVRQCAAVFALLVALAACQPEGTTLPETATIALHLTGAETGENADVRGLPQSGGVLEVP